MSNIKFTTEQETAISLRDRCLLVSASAGTGKTAVLVERIIRMATDPVNPVDLDRMLIVTFTNAASEEMKGRIRKALYKKIKSDPGNERLRRQVVLLNQANISTIHSFCSEVIRSNYHLLEIDPGFSVCDENDADGYLREAMSEVLLNAYEENTESFKKLVEGYGRGKDDSKFSKILIEIYKKIRSMPGYRDWLIKAAAKFRPEEDDFGKSKLGKLITGFSADRLGGYIGEIDEMASMITDETTLSGYIETLAEDRGILAKARDALESGNWDDSGDIIQKLDFNKLKSAKKGAPEDIKNLVKGTRDNYKKEIGRIRDRMKGTSEQIYENMSVMAPMMEKMASLLNDLDIEYSRIKNNEGTIDYSDLEHFALECLKSEAGAMYRDRFDEIFVDEYQDSNQIQEDIINLVSGRNKDDKNIFMVGDVKQSIYKFRQAEPGLFVDKYKSYSEDHDEDNVKVELFRNYRSRLPILDFANYIFSRIMSKNVGDIAYDSNVFLRQGMDYPEGNANGYPVEIKLVNGKDSELFKKDESIDTREAAAIGTEIYKLISSGMRITDKDGTERPVEYRDITILNRSANSVSDDYIRQLKKMGIPVYSGSDTDFFKEREIILIRSFLEILDNPRRDIPLLAVMRSQIFGFTDKELALIRCGSRYKSYYESLVSFDSKRSLQNKIAGFLDNLEKYRNEAKNRGMDKLVWAIMHETGMYNRCRAGENIRIKQHNLRRFFEIASVYESGRTTGLFGFIKYLENLRISGVKGSNAPGIGNNAVNLMSIHKSKGLEFPVVILSGCGKRFNKTDLRQKLIIDKEYGFGPDYINAEIGYKLNTAMKKGIAIKKDIEGMAEEMRVLYVALTRAREKLVITSFVDNLETSAIKWQLRSRTKNGKIDPGKVMLASGFIDWIMPSVINHRNANNVMEGFCNSQIEQDSGNPHFKIDVIEPLEVRKSMDYRSNSDIVTDEDIDLTYEDIKTRFEWEYPYADEGIFHKKVSVTEIKKLRDVQKGEKDIFGSSFVPVPDFMNEKAGLEAAERGTMLHNAIAAVDPASALNPGYISSLFEKLGLEGDALAIYSELITDFFKSGLGRRMLKSMKIESEKPFLIPMLTKKLYPGHPGLPTGEHSTLVQGVIDCMFYESDGIVIIDYKSDNVIEGNEKVHADRYAVQLNLYAEAVEKLTGIKVKEKYIYFLKNRCSVLL